MKLISIPANPAPDNFVAGTLKTRDGVGLRFARWLPPAGRKGTVVLLQGRAEWIEKYFETVRDLRARGFAVATIDWRGQGLSSKPSSSRSCCRIVRRHCSRSAIRPAPACSSAPPIAAAAGSTAWC
jgi:lysophospholipase